MNVSVSALIERLGGDAEVAGWFGLSAKAVELWRRRNRIPDRWQLPLYDEACRKGLSISRAEVLSTSKRA